MTEPAATAILADDEDLPRTELRRMLQAAWPGLRIVAEAEHGVAAVEAIEALRPDVAFLDIRMPGRSGLDVARAASGRCHVVFTTAHDAHAIEAFTAGALDYLLKPVQAERLAQTVQRLRERLVQRVPAADIDLRLQRLHRPHPFQLFVGERDQHGPGDDRQRDDRPAPGEGHVVVEEVEDRVGDVDQELRHELEGEWGHQRSTSPW